MNLISIYDTERLREHGLCVTPGTLKVWRHQGRYVADGLFVKFAHRLYIDTDALQKILQREQKRMMEQGRKKVEGRSFKRVKN